MSRRRTSLLWDSERARPDGSKRRFAVALLSDSGIIHPVHQPCPRMYRCALTPASTALLLLLAAPIVSGQSSRPDELKLNDQGYFETRGLNVMVFSNWYNDLFSDSKMSGVEIIHHGERTATNGDLRLNPTPEQWDPIPQFVDRRVDQAAQTVEAFLKYPDRNFEFTIKAVAGRGGLQLTVHLATPLPRELEGRAGFNLEFLPSAYFRKG